MPDAGLSVSVVSHGHGAAVIALLGQMASVLESGGVGPCRVLLTVNCPEPGLVASVRARSWPFEVVVLENSSPAGFGANHNRAFERDRKLGASTVFGVVNPDVRLLDSQPFAALLAVFAAAPQAGCVYPRQIDVAGAVQDHERLLPTPGRLLRRHLFRRRHEVPANSAGSADWVNAAFMLLRGTAFAQVGGFDERYHMYGEDVDLCLRLRLAGWILMRADSVVVEHVAQRASHRDLRHLGWHLASLLRLWRSPVYRRFKRLHVAGYSKSV